MAELSRAAANHEPPLKTFAEAMQSTMSGMAAAVVPLGEALTRAGIAATVASGHLGKLEDARRAILPSSYPTVLPAVWHYHDEHGGRLPEPRQGEAGPTPDGRAYRLGRLPAIYGERAAALQEWDRLAREQEHEEQVFAQYRRGWFRAHLAAFPEDIVERALQAALDGRSVKLHRAVNEPDRLLVDGEVIAEHDVLAAVRHLLPSA
jgi:hypothetical protein